MSLYQAVARRSEADRGSRAPNVGRRRGPAVAQALVERERRLRQVDEVAGAVPGEKRVAVGAIGADPVALGVRSRGDADLVAAVWDAVSVTMALIV